MSSSVALVTGGNRGLGFEICRKLCKVLRNTGTVILTSRDEKAGADACQQLAEEGHKVHFVPLDVTSENSIKTAVELVKKEFAGLDILINNAGILFSPSKSSSIPYAEQVEKTLMTNFFGVLLVHDFFLPLMKENSRIMNVTSRLGKLDLLQSDLRDKLCEPNLNRRDLIELMQQYSRNVKTNTHVENGWPDQDPNSWLPAAYCVSKIGVTVLTNVLAKECPSPSIAINCCCPGWAKSGIGGPNAPKSTQEGAENIVECAFLASNQPNGRYYEDRKLQRLFNASN